MVPSGLRLSGKRVRRTPRPTWTLGPTQPDFNHRSKGRLSTGPHTDLVPAGVDGAVDARAEKRHAFYRRWMFCSPLPWTCPSAAPSRPALRRIEHVAQGKPDDFDGLSKGHRNWPAGCCTRALRKTFTRLEQVAPASHTAASRPQPPLRNATSPNCARAGQPVDPMQQLPVMEFVGRGHPVCREALFEASADPAPIDLVDVLHRLNRFVLRLDDKASHAVLNYLWHRAGTISDDGRAACHGFDHDKTEGFRPVDRKQKRGGFRKIGLFRAFVDLAHQLNILAIDPGLDVALEIAGFSPRDLRGDAQRHSGRPGDPDRGFRPFLGCQPPEKRQIRPPFERRPKQICR